MFDLAGGGGNAHVQGYNAEFTWVAWWCCLIAASGGALFGYDNGELPASRLSSILSAHTQCPSQVCR